MRDFKTTSCALHCFVLCCGGMWTRVDMPMHSSRGQRKTSALLLYYSPSYSLDGESLTEPGACHFC